MAVKSLQSFLETGNKEVLEDCQRKAEKGSAKHQLLLGKLLVKQVRSGSPSTDNGKVAVKWLIKATKQGLKEASKLLQECLQENIGVDETNRDDVVMCAQEPTLDNAVRTAASKLYQDLLPSDASGSLTKKHYYECVKTFTGNKKERKFLNGTGRKLQSETEVAEQDFIETVARRMRSGQIDPLQDSVEMEAFAKAGLTRKLIKYPTASIMVMVDSGVEFLSSDGLKLALYALPVDQISLIVAFFFMSILSIDWLLTVVTTLVFYLSLAFMAVCTLQMFQNRRKQKEVRSMAEMLHTYCEQAEPEEIEERFITNSMKPYWTFFGALLVFVPLFYIVNKAWVPCSEFACISWVLAMACLFVLSNFKDILAVMSLILNIISTLPHFVIGVSSSTILNTIFKFITTPFFTMKLMKNFYLNISLPAVSNLLILALVSVMALRHSWKGVSSVLIPHMVGFFWWQIGVIFYDYSSWLGIARVSMGWTLFALATPFMTIVGFFYGIYSFYLTVKLAAVLKVVVTLSLLLIPVILAVWQGAGYELGGFTLQGRSGRTKILALVLLALLASPAAYFAMQEEEEEEDADISLLPLDLYAAYCGEQAWNNTNMAQTQINCLRFKHMTVNWTGVVLHTNITKIENAANDLLDYLPEGLSEWLKCLYGEHYAPCNKTSMTDVDYQVCEMEKAYGHSCHMRKADSYTFLLVVSATTSSRHTFDVHVTASHDFHKVILGLRAGHVIEYQGTIVKDLGGFNPMIHLKDIECLNCMMNVTGAHAHDKKPQEQAMKEVLQTISFFTSPLLEYDEDRIPQKPRKEKHTQNDKEEL